MRCVGRQRLYRVVLATIALVFGVHHACQSVHEFFSVRYVNGKRCERFSPRHLEMAYYQPKRCFSRDDVQQIMVDLVGNVSDLLHRHEIPYWLHGGTLLGSYRHKTAIPHDVDADIAVTRAGYEALRDGKFAFDHAYDLQVLAGKFHQPGTRTPGIPARFIHQASGLYTNIFVFLDEDDTSETANNTATADASDPTRRQQREHRTPLFGPIHSARFANCVHCPRVADGWAFTIPKDWVFPLTPCDFGSTIALCPAQTPQYLDHVFGADYMVVKQNW